MYAILITSGIYAVKAALPLFIKWILSYIYMETSTELSLQNQEQEMKRTMGSLSIVDEFAKYAKLQRQLNKVQQELKDANSARLSQYLKTKLLVNYSLQIIYVLVILVIVWNYKYIPAVVLPTQWTTPFGWVMSWPTGIEGGISMYMWLLMLGSSSRIMFSKIFRID